MNVNTHKVRLLAAQQGLNMKQLAEKSGISRATMSCVVNHGTCRAETAVKLYEALGVDPETIIM